jgi:hypothetical protein
MNRLSPQRRDLISVVLLIVILLAAFPLLGSWLAERVLPPRTALPTATHTPTPTPTPEATKESRAAPIDVTFAIPAHPTREDYNLRGELWR